MPEKEGEAEVANSWPADAAEQAKTHEGEEIIDPFFTSCSIPNHAQLVGAVDEFLLVRIVFVCFEKHVFKKVWEAAVFSAFSERSILNGNLDGCQGNFVVFDHHYFKTVVQFLPVVVLG